MVLFKITDEDAQFFAKEKIGRELTHKELDIVARGLEVGLEEYGPFVLETAIDEIIEK